MQLYSRCQFSFLLFVLVFCICLSVCGLSGRRALLVFMGCAAPNRNVLIHFPALRMLLCTRFERRNQVTTRAHLTNMWLKSTRGISQQLLGHCLCWKTGNVCALAQSSALIFVRRSAVAYYPLGAEKRKSFKCAFSFGEAFSKGKGKGLKVWPFKWSVSDAPRSTIFTHR